MTVLDASVVAAWFVPGQGTASAEALLAKAASTRFVAPFIFPAECRSLFLRAERRRVIDEIGTAASLRTLALFDIEVLGPPAADGHDAILALARREMLSFYDALYLQAGLRAGMGVASRDGALLMAAERCGLAAIDLRG